MKRRAFLASVVMSIASVPLFRAGRVADWFRIDKPLVIAFANFNGETLRSGPLLPDTNYHIYLRDGELLAVPNNDFSITTPPKFSFHIAPSDKAFNTIDDFGMEEHYLES